MATKDTDRFDWLWWKPLMGIVGASLITALYVFDTVPREIVAVLFVIALVGAIRAVRKS
jgi:hypothetical protein